MTPGNPPPGLWSATASVPRAEYPTLDGDIEVDAVVVGGGFAGLSTALHLSEQGVSVALLETEDIGYGASGRNGGQVNPGVKLGDDALARRFGEAGRGLFRLGEEAVDFLADLVARRGLRCHFDRAGLIRLAHSQPALRAVEEAQRGLVARGIAARLLSADEIARMVGTGRYLGGLFDPRGATVQPLDLARELARVATGAGARIFVGSAALSLEQSGARWRIRCDGGSITARSVAIATNGYTDGLVPGLAESLLPVNSFQIATDPLGPDLDGLILPGRQSVYDSRRLILYFRRSPDGRVVLGGRASFSSLREEGRTADYDVLRRVLEAIFPELAGIGIQHRWTGLVCITPDSLPHYHSPQPGLHVALGFNGRGVALSNRTGAWLAHTIMGLPDSGMIPKTEIAPIPLHRWRAPALNVAMQWSRVMDLMGR